MSDSFYDRKGIRHSSESSCERANKRYACEDWQTQQVQQRLAGLAQEQVRLSEASLQAQQALEAQQRRQTSILASRARTEEAHQQFTRDIAWLERADPAERFEYLLDRVGHRAVHAFTGRVEDEAALERMPPGQEIVATVSEAVGLESEANQAGQELSSLKAQLDEAQANLKRGGGGVVMFAAYLVFALAVAAPIANSMPSGNGFLPDWAGMSTGVLLLTSPFAILIALEVVKKARRRKAAAAAHARLVPAITAAEKRKPTAEARLAQAAERAKSAYANWSAAVDARLRGTFDSLVERGVVYECLRQVVEEEEEQFPPSLRINWEEIGPDQFIPEGRRLIKEAAPFLAESGSWDLLFEQLRNNGEGKLAEQLAIHSSVLKRLAEDERKDDQDDGADEMDTNTGSPVKR